ncbi:helix-turn-helix transcriptional regulator [Neorhizobium sp. JUb45]|uniref:helix-turn-helix domain-containing protein n=1 Tax=Neorhizobium sp. JUb45 TaxID=2485113 RepID=UPI00104B14A0|nr:helix-turn-helix transcriptional regulator [Neorhizobium sp. JUb45]
MQAKSLNTIDVHVGSQIRLRRKSMHLTQAGLASQIGITFQQLQKYEKGVNRVGASRLVAIATALDVNVASFFEGYTDPTSAALVDTEHLALRQFMISSDGFALNQAFFRIASLPTRQRILALVKCLADPTIVNPSDDDLLVSDQD